MKNIMGAVVCFAVLLCAPQDAYAGGDVREVVQKIASSLLAKHSGAKAALLESSADRAFNEYFTVNAPEKKRAAKAAVEKLMLEFSKKHDSGEMCLIGAGGPELARVNDGHIAHDLDPNEVDNEFFGPAMAQKPKTVYITRPYISHDMKKWVIAYATPIAFSGQTKAILHFEYSLEAYQMLLRQADNPEMRAMLVSAEGNILGDSRAIIPVSQLGEDNKPESYFKKFSLSGLTLDAVKNKLRGGAGRLGQGDNALSVAWRALPSDMTLVVVQDP